MTIIPTYIETLARSFWEQTSKIKGQPPYDIAGAVSLTLPLDIVSLSDLTLCKVHKWLTSNDIQIPINVNDRHLHGFILVSKGFGFMFINGTDSEDERRYTIAHEAGHFILDYKVPRDKAIKKLGESIRDVLDGLREPTIEEQINGLVKEISVRPFTHLLEKNGDGSFESIQVFNSENRADMLAVELLAPYSQVIKTTLSGRQRMSFALFDQCCLDILISKYNLPVLIAKQYSKKLAYSVTGRPSIMDKLGFSDIDF